VNSLGVRAGDDHRVRQRTGDAACDHGEDEADDGIALIREPCLLDQERFSRADGRLN
jgi:hypothetical protein